MVEINYERICLSCNRDPCECAARAAANQAATGTTADLIAREALRERVLSEDPATVGEIDERMLQPEVLSGCAVRAAIQLIDADAARANGGVFAVDMHGAHPELHEEYPLKMLESPPLAPVKLRTVVVDCPHCGRWIQLSPSKTKV